MTANIAVRSYEPGDDAVLVDILCTARRKGEAYPSLAIPADTPSLTRWLNAHPAYCRWVATADGAPIGHAQVESADDQVNPTLPRLARYLRSRPQLARRPVMEIARLFVAPNMRGFGVGARLLDAATNCIRDLGHQPALCVLDSQHAAIRMYLRHGWHRVGSYPDADGRPLLAFLAPSPGTRGGLPRRANR